VSRLSKVFLLNRENLKVILLCILGAFIFWLFRSLNKEYSTRINYPIEFIYPEDSVVLVEELPEEIRIDVSSGGWNLLRKSYWFNQKPLTIRLDEPAETKFIPRSSLAPLISDQLTDLTLNYIVTDTLYVAIEKKESKKLKVVVDSANISLEENFRITSSFALSPDSVWISGPQSMISKMPDSIYIMPNREEIDANFDEVIEIDLQNSLLEIQPGTIRLAFDVAQFQERSISVEIKPKDFPDTTYTLSDSTVRLDFLIRESNVPRLHDSLFVIIANYKDINLSDSTLIPRVIKRPLFVEDISIDPLQVKVRREN